MKIFPDIRNSGSGISGEDFRKKGFRGFFGILFRKAWKLFVLNMLLMMFIAPGAIGAMLFMTGQIPMVIIGAILFLASVITTGPALGGFFKVLRAFTLEEPIFMAHTFFKAVKSEFKVNMFFGIINYIVIFAMYSAIKIYPLAFQDHTYLKYFSIAITAFVFFTVIVMDFYYFLLSTATDLKFSDIIKDSFFFVSIALKTNIIVLIVVAALTALTALLAWRFNLWILFFFFPASLNGLIITFWCYPYIRKYVINPYYKQIDEINPEMEFEASKDKAVFTDMGGKEKPIHFDEKSSSGKGKKKARGRDIS